VKGCFVQLHSGRVYRKAIHGVLLEGESLQIYELVLLSSFDFDVQNINSETISKFQISMSSRRGIVVRKDPA
jgi:hypothetical protein